MTYALGPEVPLGPFEGAAVTVWSAQGRQARLHAKRSCSYLRTARVTQREVGLDASVVGRLCPSCGAYGSWARPGTGLSIFLGAVTGLGLLYELDRYVKADEDTCSDEEVAHAASVLCRPPSGSGDGLAAEDSAEAAEDEAFEALQEARHVRKIVFAEWGGALASLNRVHQVLELFPWLRPWAEPRVQRKIDYLERLRAQAARLVLRESLVGAAAVSLQQTPALPAGDPVFAPLGTAPQQAEQLTSLWRRWRGRVADSWDPPREQHYLVHHLVSGMSSRRKGREQLLERAQILLAEWEQAARSAAPGDQGERVLVARVPDTVRPAGKARESFPDRLSEWEQGVLASYMITTAGSPPAQPAVTVRVPEPVATRLLSQQSVLSYAEQRPEPSPAAVAVRSQADDSGLGPGVFDDTPVSHRRLLTAEHLRALRSTVRDAEQLYVVLGLETGVEVVALSMLEQRCAAGWQGILLAGASDLPGALIEPRQQAVSEEAAEGSSVWASPVYDPRDPAFGRSLSMAEGERVLVRLCEGRRDVGHALRSLALARSVPDLRDLGDGGYDDRGVARSPFAPAVWNGLLAMEQLDLEPFEPAADSDGRGSGLPLGMLARVQAYTTDAAGRYQGRAHSPGCAHRRAQPGVDRHDEMVTVEELLGNKGFDPCSKCGGYAVRRLTAAQVAYYRAAHQLHDCAQRVRATVWHRSAGDGSATVTALEEFDDLDARTAQACFPDHSQARQWRRAVDRLRRELQGSSAE
ncbi:hypothetical protein [Streptomyces poonensis]|uniref:Uncharacterized protein n=1 Tax=Streptomyces poonensis TaxID=68255 RepID=A0A918UYG5_9ACTN|nr:hypothetical protein [Streptomyces poonensis]GGZ44302.1 hypothetical protein GCM10010365_75920 [Streptomyces poonensis]